MKDRQSPTPGSPSSIQELPLKEEQLPPSLEGPTNDETPAETPSAQSGAQSRAQEPRLEEEYVSENEEPTIHEEILADAEPLIVATQDVSQQTVETCYEMDAESADNASETEEQAALSRAPGSNGRRVLRRVRRPRARPIKLRPLTVLQRMIRLEERHISLTRDNAAALNHVADSVDRLATFITECSRRIAGSLN